MPNLARAFDVLYRIMDKKWKNFLNFPGSIAKKQKSVILKIKFDNIRKKVAAMKKLLALLMAVTLTFQLVTPVFAEEIEETQASTETVEVETETSVTEIPTTEPPVPETAVPEETSAPTEPQPTTEATETTASTEETIATTEPTEETTEPTLDLFAEDGNVIASGECGAQGDNLTWVLTSDGTLAISGTGKMGNYYGGKDHTDAPWGAYWDRVTTVVIEPGVTSIGVFAFEGCSSLTSVTIPEGVTSIGIGAFSGCSGLTSVTIPEGVTSIGDNAFTGCSSLTSVTVPEGVMSIGVGIFWGCSSLTNVTIPEGVTSIGFYAFCECSSLTSVSIPDSVTSIDVGAFEGCSSLTSVSIPESVTSISNAAFSGCSSLTSVTIPEGVTSIGDYAFYECSSLASVTIPDNVTNIGSSAFSGCSSLKSVEIEGAASIEDHAFSGCKKLTDVTFSGNVTSIGDSAFSACERLTNVVLPESVTDIGANAFSSCERLTSVAMPGVISIGADAFRGCENLTDVALPKSVSSIAGNVFTYCYNLERISVDKENGNYISADGVLFDKNYTTLITYPTAKKNTVYNIPKSVTTIVSGAFWDCDSLTSVTIPEGVTSIGDYAFFGCSALASVNIPKGVTSIGEDTFACCALTKLTIPEGVTQIGDDAFRDCDRLTSVVIPGSVASIGNQAFSGCWILTRIVITDGVGSVGESAFENCRKLIKLWLPKTVTFIDYDAFSGCDNLKNVYYSGSNSDWNAITIEDGNAALENAKRTYGVTETPGTEIRPIDTTALTSGGKLTLTAWAMPDNKKAKVKWSLSEDSKAYASISSSGVLTAKTVSEVQNVTVIVAPTDGSPEARKEIQILPKITAKQTEKFNLFYGNGRAKLAITGGQVASARFVEPSDFALEDNDGQFYIRLAEGASAKPKTKVTLEITLPGCDTPIKQSLTIATMTAAPKLKLNPTASIVNTTLTNSLTVETAILGTEDTLTVRSATKGVTASVDNGILTLTLDNAKTTTATVYLKGSDWAKEIKLTHRITVTDKKPTVKLSAKGKLDVLNPASEIIYTPKLANATGTITDVRLEGQDANLFNAEVVDGLVHLTLAKSGENYTTKKTYKVTPVVTLLGKGITAPTLSIKVTQSALKLAKLPNRMVYQSQTAPLAVKLTATSPANAKIGDVQLNAKTTAALRNALEAAGGIQVDEATVTFPASAFAALKPGRYTVILDVFPANAASDTKPIQARFTLTVQK